MKFNVSYLNREDKEMVIDAVTRFVIMNGLGDNVIPAQIRKGLITAAIARMSAEVETSLLFEEDCERKQSFAINPDT